MIWCELKVNRVWVGVGVGAGNHSVKGQLTPPEALELWVDEGSRALEKRMWTATVCRGYKRAIKQGQPEVTPRGLEKHTLTHSASFPPFSARSFTHQCSCLSFSQTAGSVTLLPLSTSFTVLICTHFFSVAMPEVV